MWYWKKRRVLSNAVTPGALTFKDEKLQLQLGVSYFDLISVPNLCPQIYIDYTCIQETDAAEKIYTEQQRGNTYYAMYIKVGRQKYYLVPLTSVTGKEDESRKIVCSLKSRLNKKYGDVYLWQDETIDSDANVAIKTL